jgi:CHAT domain-containing protein/Tfp pilus assembly protein PilF
LAKAEEYHRRALAIRRKLAPDSLAVASSLNNLGNVLDDLGDLSKAQEAHSEALAIRQKLAPDSLLLAASLNNLGSVLIHRGDGAKAEEYYRQALEIREKLAPGSIDVAASLCNLGLIAWGNGDLDKAEKQYRQALAIDERLAPGGDGVASDLTNLGLLVEDRGDLALAEQYDLQALEIKKKQAPESSEVAIVLNNLGDVAEDRGDLAKAEEYELQSLAIFEKLFPGSANAAASLQNLGDIAANQGDLDKADKYLLQSLAIREKLEPPSIAATLIPLGDVALRRGDLAKAEEYFSRASAIYKELAPGCLRMANTDSYLGDIARRRKDLTGAEAYYRQALQIRKNIAPQSIDYADLLATLAGLKRDQGQLDAAGELYSEALKVFESVTARLGGSGEVRSAFRAKHADYYGQYMDLLMSQNRPELAFQVLERSRARTLLETLSEAHINIRQGADPVLLDRERTLQTALRAKMSQRIELAESKQGNEQAGLNKETDELLAQYDEIEGRIRTTSPKYAALTQPQPLDAKAIQDQLLDPDTLLLEYALGQERSYVFAVTSTTLHAYQLPKEAEIESAARHLYELLTAQNRWIQGESGPQRKLRLKSTEAEYSAAADKLSSMVLGPVTAQLGGKRLLIVSDGALQYIPFSALPVPGESDASRPLQHGVPLVAEHEIVSLPSVSVLAVLRQDQGLRGTEARKTVAVLADPVFDGNDSRVLRKPSSSPGARSPEKIDANADVEFRLARSVEDVSLRAVDGVPLPRLAFSRQEANAILALTAEGQGLQAVDFQASRETALRPDLSQYRIVHFATHGLLDSKHPELSGLVLSLVDEQGNRRNGFLDLEDIYNLNLPVDLVVLSACETGLGKVISGEGLVGLTRGFMYAGASRVVASLWKVDDEATAELMERFYRGMLKEGKTPGAALREAQLAMSKQKRWSAPYYWAAFVLQGEWR